MAQSVEGPVIPSLPDSDSSLAMPDQSPGMVDGTQADKQTVLDKKQAHQILDSEFALAKEHGKPLSVITLDVNALKAVNDEMGHGDGDSLINLVETVIDIVPKALRTTPTDEQPTDKEPRPADIIGVGSIDYSRFETLHNMPEGSTSGRVGGDEYLIILPDTDTEGVAVVAKRIQEMVDKRLAGPEGDKFRARGINVGVALGVASLDSDMTNSSDLLSLADQRMYMDKMLQVEPLDEEQMKHLRASLEHLHQANVRPRDLPRYIAWLGQTGLVEQVIPSNLEDNRSA